MSQIPYTKAELLSALRAQQSLSPVVLNLGELAYEIIKRGADDDAVREVCEKAVKQ